MAMDVETVKARTLELYSLLPIDDEEKRKIRYDIRDEIYELNSKLLHKITQNTFLDHNRYDYEDRLQEVSLQFLEIWWWFQYPPRYKSEASFSSYFYIRLKERAERSLNELSYSMYRSTLAQCQALLGLEHWTQVKPEMLSQIKGNSDVVSLALRMMHRNYYTAIEDHYDLAATPIILESNINSYIHNPSDVKRLLVSEMIIRESRLDSSELFEISDIHCIPVGELMKDLDEARSELYFRLKEAEEEGEL